MKIFEHVENEMHLKLNLQIIQVPIMNYNYEVHAIY